MAVILKPSSADQTGAPLKLLLGGAFVCALTAHVPNVTIPADNPPWKNAFVPSLKT